MKNFLRVSRSALLTVLVLIIVALQGVMGQTVASYSFSQSSGTYSAISGGTNTASTNAALIDDNNYTALSIGFTFNYRGTAYTQFGINGNGWIMLGGGAMSNSTTPISTGTSNNVVSAFGPDISGRQNFVVTRTSGSPTLTVTSGNTANIVIGSAIHGTGIPAGATVFSVTATTIVMSANASTGGTGSHARVYSSSTGIRYQTIGTAPNRTLVVQWTEFSRHSTSASNGDRLNFQIRLNETSNTINVVYNLATPTAAGLLSTQVGLRGASNADYNNRTTTTDWSATTAGGANIANCSFNNTVVPASGLTFTWTPPACMTSAPTAPTVSSVTATSANVSWTAPSSAPSNGYFYAVTTSATPPSNGTGTAAAGTGPHSVSLSASTTYYLHVQGFCGGSAYSTWATSALFTTPCAAITALPHTEAFASFLPNSCWQEGDAGNLTAGPTTVWNAATASASWAVDGFLNSGTTGAAKVNLDATGDNDWLISPQFTLPASPNYRLKYSVAATQFGATTAPSTAWEADDFVEVLISTTGNTNWTILRTYNSGNVPSNLGQIDISDLSAYAGQTFRIAFRGVEGASNGSADIDFFIDDFIVEVIPSCLPPTAPTVASVTTTSASVSWTAPSPAPSNGYFYAVTTSATPPANGSGTAAAGTGPLSVSLLANTTYYLHVQCFCGGSDYSTWATSAVFNTLEGNTCGLSQDLALLTSPFSGTTVGYSDNFTTTSGTCLTGTGGDRVFRIDVPNNNELFIGQSVNGYDSRHRIAVGGACPGTTEINTGYVANFPTTQINGTDAGCLDDNDVTHYYYRNTSGSTQTVYWVQDGHLTNQGTFTLEWRLIDCLAPTAPTVSSVTSVSANVSWTAPPAAPSNGYIYAVTTSATPPANGSGTAVAGTGPHSVTLLPTTTYYLHVQGFCGGTNYSAWATSAAFTTPCAPITALPHTEDFGTYLPNTCWQEGDAGNLTAGPTTISATAAIWGVDGFLNSGTTGAARMNIDATGENDWLISPQFTLPASPNYRLKYSVGATQYLGTTAPTTAWEADDFVEVLISTTGNTNWTILRTYNSGNVPSHLGQIDLSDLSAYAGQTFRIAFRGVEGITNGGADIDFHIDNFIIEEVPNCAEPTAPMVGSVTTTSADVSWTAPSPAPSNGYFYAVTTSATPPANGSGTADVGTGPHSVSLSANTTYYLHVQGYCGGSDYSTWATSAVFNTLEGNTCLQAQDLALLTSPFSGTTIGYSNTFTTTSGTCLTGTGGDRVFRIDVPNNFELFIGQSVNGYDSRHRVAVGGACPGTTEINTGYVANFPSTQTNGAFAGCLNDNDLTHYYYKNTSGSTQTVYWVQDGQTAGQGTFTLEWQLISCLVPTAPTVASITATSANVSWTAPSAAPSNGYFYAVTTSATPPANGSGTAASGTGPLSVSLLANTTYYLHVQSFCGGSDYSTWATSAVFNTLEGNTCLQSQDLALLTSPFSGTTVGYSDNFTTTSGTCLTGTGGDRVFRIDVPNNNELFIGQSVNNYDSRHRIAFGGACPGTTEINTGYVANFPTTQINGSDAGCLDDSDLTHYYYKNTSGSTQTVYWIQDGHLANQGTFTLEWQLVAPPTCLPPTAPTVASVTTTSASVSWTAPSPAPSDGYFYAVTTSATPPANGSGTAAAGTGPLSVSLLANTTYYLHVQSFCGGSDYSTWATSAVFNTLEGNTCLQAQDLALLTSPFSGTTIGYSDNFTTTSGACLTGTGGDRVFRIDVPNNYELFIGQSVNGYNSRHRIAVGGACPGTTEINTGYVANFPTTHTNGAFAGCLNEDDLTHYYYKNTSGSTQTVYWIQDGNTTGQGTFTLEWQLISCLVPTAPTVASITATSANVSWTAPSAAPSNGYFYAVTTSATPPTNGSGTAVTGTGPHSVSLSANTTYYLHVQGFCGGSDYSTWATSSAFTTPCAAITSLPWIEGFEGLASVSTTIFPACWLEGTGTNWRSQDVSTTTYNNPRTGTKYIGCDYLGTDDRIWTPGFALTAGVSYEFSTFFVGDGYSGWTGNIVYNTSQSGTGETVLGAAFISTSTTSTSGTNYAQISRTFVAPATATYHFGVRITSTSTPWSSMGFDDFSLTQLVNCSGAPSAGTPPAATNVCSGGTTTLTITGATTGSGISYQWEEWNGSAWVNAVGGSGATTESYTTAALTSTMQYRFTVLCTPSSQSASTTGISVTVGVPANDACATAQSITVGAAPITGSVACAAAGSGGCLGSTSDYDVWYSFTVGSTADYKINLIPSAGFDGVFQLYNGCGGSLVSSPSNSYGAPQSCIDGYAAGGLEFANYSLTPGTYFVRVFDYNDIGTAYPSTTTFTLEVVIPVSACDAPTNIPLCGTNINTVIASGAGDWSDFYDCSTLLFDLLGKESVFTYTPAVTSSDYTLTVNSLSPSGTGNYINFMYKASTCSALGVWDCIDERNGTGTSPSFAMTAGVTYYFLLKPELTTGYTINWRIDCPPTPPVNDACASATALPCGTTNLAGTTVASVSETVSIGCTMSQFGVWYSFVGNGFATTISSTATFDHEMGIASGSCGSLVNVACRDAVFGTFAETHTFTTSVGVTYYVYIAHRGAANATTGTFTISRTCTVNEWTGNALNTDWATNGNWSTGTAPTSAGTAYIPASPAGANFPTIDEAAQIATLTLATGATLNIQSGNSMTVTGVLTNNGTVNVASGGSLVQTATSTLAGSGIYNVTRAGSSVYDYWSSPITNASVGILGGTVYQYNPASGTADPSDDAFDPGWITAGGSMAIGKGYAAYGAGTRTFTGTVNNGQVDASVVYATNPAVPYNLIGNPYPSAINVGDFLTLNSSKLPTGEVYLWDDPGSSTYVSGDYAQMNNATYIAGGGGTPNPGLRIGSLQGFKVAVNATASGGAAFLRFTNDMRTNTNTNVLFRQAERKLLWLSTLSANNNYNQLAVGFFEDGTDGEDWGYDSPKFNSLGALSFFSYMDGSPYGIQVYSELEPERIVPLGLNSQAQTLVTIALDSTENIIEDVILEDRHMGIFHDLRVSSYVFQSAPMLYSDRFFLHFASQMVTGITSANAAPEVQAYIANDMLNLRSTSRLTGTLQMFDMSGKMVLETSNVTLGAELLKVDVSHLAKGVYSVRIQDSKKAHVQKVIK